MDSDTLNHWRQTIKRILGELAAIPFPDVVNLSAHAVFDESSDNYLVVLEGWKDVQRQHGILVHVAIRNDKIWIQLDGTEYGIARELTEAGIPKEKIVLGFKSPQSRPHTGFAVA